MAPAVPQLAGEPGNRTGRKYPVHVVTSWLGNTPSIAMRHYLMTTDEHFEAAVKGDEQAAEPPEESGAKCGAAGARRGIAANRRSQGRA